MRVAVIGAGNGGQAIAGYLSVQGYCVSLYDRSEERVQQLLSQGGIYLEGKLKGFGKLSVVSSNLSKVVQAADIIMITVVANAHKIIAESLVNVLEDNQIVILNPGRTCGALEFKRTLVNFGCTKKLYIAEAQTLVYACRLIEEGRVNIIGIKDKVLLSALPAKDTQYVLDKVAKIYPCFEQAENILRTSLENIGAIFHPCVLLFNAATIERNKEFYFYRDMTPRIANFIEEFDKERLAVGKAYGIDLLSVSEWISSAYSGIEGNTLCEKMKNNPAYYDIKSPSTIYTRQLLEDIPAGVLPILELGKVAGLKMPLFESMVNICSSLLGVDFISDGRSLFNLGLAGLTKQEIIDVINGNT